MGNAVKTGRARRCDLPPDSLCIKEKGNSFSMLCHCHGARIGAPMGRPLEGEGSQKTCLNAAPAVSVTFADRG